MKRAIFFFAFLNLAVAQTPSGMVEGIIRDSSGAVAPGAQVHAVNVQTGGSRSAVTSDVGSYVLTVLPAGEYMISAKAAGFQTVVRPVIVEAGVTTQSDFTLTISDVTESITVEGAAPQIRYDSHTVGGLITRGQIENLPLNGRNYLELAKLNPGVQPPTRASSNRLFVPTLGAPGGNNGRGTHVTLDGGSVMVIGNGGSAMGFSQDAVQEFQVATVNFDLSTGATVSGAINVVTRSGGNAIHGSAFYFFRDHNLAAYPALGIRDTANPDPFFQRRQFGLAIGGPIRRDRFFYFGGWERNEQRGVGTTILAEPFAHLSRITVSPFFGDQATIRFDGRLSSKHTAFFRYSHDGNRAFSAPTNARNAYPSSWTRQTGWSDQGVLGVTSAFPTLVNDFRFSYFFTSSKQLPARDQDCVGCLGIGAPTINVDGGPVLGNGDVFLNVGRRFHVNNAVTLLSGNHRLRFGIDWEHNRGGPVNTRFEPASIQLFSPVRAQLEGIPTPAAFRTLDDILALPLRSFTVGFGNPRVPQEDGAKVRNWNTAQLFLHDTWRLRQNVVANYGLGWSMDRNLNYDLSKPRLLAPVLGENGLGPTRKEWNNFSPALGLAWAPSSDGNTVIRGGAGLFYDFFLGNALDDERVELGPPGLGRLSRSGISIPNPLPGIPGVDVGTKLDFSRPTRFTGAHLMEILPAIRADLARSIENPDRSVRLIEISKTNDNGINGRDVPRMSALHVNAGVQRRITADLVVSADMVYRHFNHVGMGSVDVNHFRSVQGPVIPACSPVTLEDPRAVCSNGPINVNVQGGRVTYKGLLVRAERRLSRGLQFIGSWAWSSNTGTTGDGANGFNLHNWLENRGPLPFDLTHIVNLAGVKRLPWRFDLGVNFSYSSVPPFNAFVGTTDLNGDGSDTGDLLPGSTYNAFNRGLDRDDLVRLVAQFTGQKLTLPAHYSLGDNFHSLDVRLSRSFPFRDRGVMTVIADGFNGYNAANLSGYRGDLTNLATFGQHTGRVTPLFGSGGPRAFQLAIKITF